MRIALLALGIATALASTDASAGSLKPGLYLLAGTQQLCVVADGTWYATTYANWGGRWAGTVLWGNYEGGAGNDTIVPGKKLWVEWRDDGTSNLMQSPITFKMIAKTCTAAAGVQPSAKPNPADR
jgi:hypothetical protein